MQRYLSQTPRTVKPGRIVVHNHVRPVEPLGLNGFRAWTDEATPKDYAVEPCSCDWAAHLPAHYRVKFEA